MFYVSWARVHIFFWVLGLSKIGENELICGQLKDGLGMSWEIQSKHKGQFEYLKTKPKTQESI